MLTLSDCRKIMDAHLVHRTCLYFKPKVYIYNYIYLDINKLNIPIEFIYDPEVIVFVQINAPFVSLTSIRSARSFKGPLKCKSP